MTMENIEKIGCKQETKSAYVSTEDSEPWYFTRS